MNAARHIPRPVLATVAAALYCVSSGLQALELRQTVWESAARASGIDPYLVYAVALVESKRAVGGNGVAPWPWALGTSGGSIFADSQLEAVRLLRHAAQEHSNVDVGIMQISTFWHGHRVKDLVDLLEPKINVHLGAEILHEAMTSAPGDLELGVGRYHSWSDVKARKYGRVVLQVHANLLRLKAKAGRDEP